MVAQLRSGSQGIRALGKVDKVYLDNTNLIYSLTNENSNTGNIRETFFLNQTRVSHQVASSSIADFTVDSIDFEVGGKSKELKQNKNDKKLYIVKDDIEHGYLNVLPLWHFGLLY